MVRVEFVILFAFIYFASDLSKMPFSSFPKKQLRVNRQVHCAATRNRWPTTAAIMSSPTWRGRSTHSVLVQSPTTGTVKSARTGTSLPLTNTPQLFSASSLGIHFTCSPSSQIFFHKYTLGRALTLTDPRRDWAASNDEKVADDNGAPLVLQVVIGHVHRKAGCNVDNDTWRQKLTL